MDEPADIIALREALAFSPDNLPLILHLLRSLARYGRHEAIATEARAALKRFPRQAEVELALAQACLELGKSTEALVILEDQEQRQVLTPAARLVLARALAETGDNDKAGRLYREARDADPACVDADLETKFAAPPPSFGGRVEPVRVDAGPGDYIADPERPKITFADVGGMDDLKEQIRLKIIHPLQHAELFKAYGKKIGGGILLYGPPGCGKTYLARATAGEVQASFFSLGLHEVLGMWMGQSEKNLHALFEQARRAAPSVLFVDEVDALGASRADVRHSGLRTTINQFLAELDGLSASNDGLLVLGATNAPWHLDSALRRPGRFDQVIFVPPPDAEARAAILRVLLKDRPAEKVNYDAVAARTEGFSGADLKGLVDRAIEAKLAEAMKKGGLLPLSTKDLEQAAKRLKPSTQEWFASARNHALYANTGGVYDDILEFLKIKKP